MLFSEDPLEDTLGRGLIDMNGGKGLLASLFSFVGAFALVTPTCLGWFYEPKRPDELESK